jgi:citrate lyase beta subunit
MTLRTTLDAGATEDVVAVIEAAADAYEARRRRGAWHGRQPVHTVYVPADRFDAGTLAAWRDDATDLVDRHLASPDDLADVFGIDRDLAPDVRARVAAKLAAEPIEDLRIDFEDGYGDRDDDVEDADARRAAQVIAGSGAPAFVGLRVKSFADGRHLRAVRTLDGFVTALLDATGGTLPDGFVITFPKIVAVAHVEAFATLLDRLEHAVGLPERSLVFEIQVETTASVLGHAGRATLPALVDAAAGRLVGVHFGVFDYTAACGLPGDQQRLDHPACDFARHVMQVTLAGTGIRLSDGSTNRTPADDSTAAVHAVWAHHAALVRHSLTHGFYQGWDMHPSHLVSRFAVVHAFHLAHLDDTTARLAAWSTAAGPSGVVDEPATIRALLGSLRRAVDCGAIDADDACAAAGIDRATLDGAG